jgi:hypothetical protein
LRRDVAPAPENASETNGEETARATNAAFVEKPKIALSAALWMRDIRLPPHFTEP